MSEGSSSTSANASSSGSSPPFQLPGSNWMAKPDPRTPHTRAKIPIHQSLGEYPLIDIDPHFGRVMRYMRPSDLAGWAGLTAVAPFLFLSYNRWDTTSRFELRTVRSAVRLNGLFGFCLGFTLAYMDSSKRFWGINENAREVQKDHEELSARAAKGLPLYGSSALSPYMQGVAARNSTFSQMMLIAMPWFNLVNHPYHGVETAKYYGGINSTPSS